MDTSELQQIDEVPFNPGDRVIKAGDEDASVGVVIEVMPPEKNTAV